jgi:raffinose/stachyose/melibiose transport system permease protein
VLSAFAFVSVYPLVMLLAIALKPVGALVGNVPLLPNTFDLHNFSRAWDEAHVGPALVTSGEIALIVATATVVFSTLAGYAFATMRFLGSGVLFGLLLMGLVIPTEALIVPLYYDLRDIHLTDTVWSVVLPQTAASVAFGTFWMRAFFAAVPAELSEAAFVDGAYRLQTLRRVLLPAARPAMQTLALLVFLSSFNDFLLPLVMLQDPGTQTVPLSVAAFKGPHTTDLAGTAAVALLACLPVVGVYLFLQRRLIEGLTAGAVKG